MILLEMGEDCNKKEVDLGRQLEEGLVGRSWVRERGKGKLLGVYLPRKPSLLSFKIKQF